MSLFSKDVYITHLGDLERALQHLDTQSRPHRFVMVPPPKKEGDKGALTLQWNDPKLALTMPYEAITDPTPLPDGTGTVVHVKLEGSIKGPYGMGSVHMIPISE